MIREFLAASPHLVFPIAGLVIFLTLFLIVLGYVFIGLRRPNDVAPLALLPFEDGEKPRSGRGEVNP